MRVAVNYYTSRDKADDVVASIGSAGGQAMARNASDERDCTCGDGLGFRRAVAA